MGTHNGDVRSDAVAADELVDGFTLDCCLASSSIPSFEVERDSTHMASCWCSCSVIDTLPLVSGEEAHAKGAEGARRAKRWLELTTRANVQWVNPEPVAVRKLTFAWVDGKTFSFDLGGVLLGEELHGQEFLAESKYYQTALDQGSHYLRFLAGCYRAYFLRPERCDNFLWITWSPFNVNTWDELRTAAQVRKAVLKHSPQVLGCDASDASGVVDDDACKAVSERLWMIVLTDRQEDLIISREHLGVIRQYDTRKGV